jgi:hypothetical protein
VLLAGVPAAFPFVRKSKTLDANWQTKLVRPHQRLLAGGFGVAVGAAFAPAAGTADGAAHPSAKNPTSHGRPTGVARIRAAEVPRRPRQRA